MPRLLLDSVYDFVLVLVPDLTQLVHSVTVDHMVYDGIECFRCVPVCRFPFLLLLLKCFDPCLVVIQLLDWLH